MMSPARYSKKCNEHLALRRSSTTACKAVALNRFRDLLTVISFEKSYGKPNDGYFVVDSISSAIPTHQLPRESFYEFYNCIRNHFFSYLACFCLPLSADITKLRPSGFIDFL